MVRCFSTPFRSVSTVPQTHVGVIIFRHNVTNELLLLGNVVWRDAHRCWKWLSRFGLAAWCRPSIAPPVRGGAAVVCANIHYDVLLLSVFVWRDARSCRTMSIRSARAALPTIDLASRARWRRRRVRQGCLRCTSTSCYCVTRRALMSDDVDPLRRGRSVDHRCRRPCMVAPPPCAPRLPTMYQCLLLSCGWTSADVGQCRLVLMRGAVSTRDLAAHARWHRRRVRHGCLRCNSARCCCLVERAQMLVNADSSRRATQCRPSTSPPVHGGAAFVSANVAYDVPVLAVVVWWD
jgi:hypothetical protein